MSDVLIRALVAGLLGAVAATLVLLLLQRRRAQALLTRVASRLQPSVGLYLRRKVAEAGLDPGALPNEADAGAQLEHYATMAEALLAHERRTIEMGDTQEIGLARTMRMESTDELAAAAESQAAGSQTAERQTAGSQAATPSSAQQ